MVKIKKVVLVFVIAILQLSYAGDIGGILKKYGCTGCHSEYGVVAGPPFWEVKKRYMEKFRNDKQRVQDYLKSSIKKGSSGKWFQLIGIKMPAFPQIKEEELEMITEYITSLKPPEE